MRWQWALWWVLAVMAAPAAGASDCADRLTIRFADGLTACLTDFPLSEVSPYGWSTPVRAMMPAHGYYAIAAAPRHAHCPKALGMDVAVSNGATISVIATETDKRSAKALQDCRLQGAGAAPDCACQELLSDGVSRLTVPQFVAAVGSHPSLAARLEGQARIRQDATPAIGVSLTDDSCSARHLIRLSDGRSACLTDFLLSEDTAFGMSTTVRAMMPGNGIFSIASTPRQPHCPRGIGVEVPSTSAMNTTMVGEVGVRRAKALQDCRLQAPSASADCACQELVTDGASPLLAAQFVAMAGPRPELVARMEQLLATPPAAASPAPAPTLEPGPCEDRLRFRFADGGRGCLTDFDMARRTAAGWSAPLAASVASSGAYVIAAPTSDPLSCPGAFGLAQHSFLPTQAVPQGYGIAERSARALSECQTAVKAAAPNGWACLCRVVVADGESPLTRAEWERFRSPAVLAQPGWPGPASEAALALTGAALSGTKTAAPMAAPATPAPTAATPVGSGRAREGDAPTRVAAAGQPRAEPPIASLLATDRTRDRTDATAAELAALRLQIESLRAEMARTAASTSPADARPRPGARARALVIGNSAYATLGTLPNPRRDAEAIAARFRSYGIDVDIALDTGRAALVRALTEYGRNAADYDINILFYAGHGVQVGGTNYIVPVDLPTAGATLGSIRLNAVSLNDALEYLPARTRVVFLDACRDNPLSRSLVATRGTAAPGLAPVNATSGTLVAYATKDGSVAEDGSGANSPYTAALLQHLDAEEDIAVVLRRVRESVLAATRNRQEPWEYGSLVGDRLVLSRIGR